MNDKSNLELQQALIEKEKIINQLHQENIQMEKQLEELNEKLLESEAFKSHFISNVTNEIVNPFSSILGLSKSMMSAEEQQRDQVCHLASLIYSEASFLDFQLNNTFAAAKLEAGEVFVEVSRVDLEQLLVQVLENLLPEQERKHMKIDYRLLPETPLFFHTDREKLRLILVNLVSNAIKFSEKEKSIVITMKVGELGLEMEIKDEGIGMEVDEVGKIFDRFHRSDKRIHSLNPGNGLGLAVVDGLVHVLDGNIRVESHPGKGSTFMITLPESAPGEDIFDDDGLFTEEDGNEELF